MDKKEKKKKLKEFKRDVDLKNMSLAFSSPPSGGASDPGTDYSSKINAEGTWEGPFANDHAAAAKREVDALVDVFTGLSTDVQVEIDALD